MMMESFFREGHLWGLAFFLLADFGWRHMLRSYQDPGCWKAANRWASVAFLLVLVPLVWLDLYAINFLSQRLMMVLLILELGPALRPL